MTHPVLHHFLDRMASTPEVAGLCDRAARPDDNLVVDKLHGGSPAALAALLARRSNRPLMVLTSSLERAESLTDGLRFFGADALIFPGFETLPFETQEPALHLIAARSRVLGRLVAGRPGSPPPIIVAPVDALAFLNPPREELQRLSVRIRWGEPVHTERLAETLVEMGYRREPLVEAPGEFAIRGSIIDLFPPEAEWPWRLDLFGEDLDQIRRFDPSTQRSLAATEEVELIEVLPAASHQPKLERLVAGRPLVSFFDLLPPETLIVRDGPGRVEQRLLHFEETADRHWQDVTRVRKGDEEPSFFATHDLEPGDWLLAPAAVNRALAGFQRVDFTVGLDDSEVDPLRDAERSEATARAEHRVEIPAQSFESVPSQFAEYLGLIRERLRRGHWVVLACDNNGQVMRLDELLRENDISAAVLSGEEDGAGRLRPADASALPSGPDKACPDVLLTVGELHEGFHWPQAGVFVATDREIFGRYKRRHIYRRGSRGKSITKPSEINRGDFVVHMEHGIGRYEGIRRQAVDGTVTELLELHYQEGDKLLVPVGKLHLVQKYAAADGKQPALDKLGAKKWQRRRRKSMEAVRKLAGELLELYARRAAARGLPCSADTTWQQEFEASFIYQETPDQMQAIEEVKRDLEAERPMDRLVCGDVGYGKTEVAIRAAFKVLTEKRQVAVLAPTTLLVQQHFTTFCERFADYPFKVEMISRFVSAARQKEVIDRLEKGEVDLVVGTHRLLSKDVRFRQLGLLVVDEEQRFGVAQKERIKSLRADVDILTLSATPIPRTLYMAMAGLRDLSIISTPPASRLPIRTRTLRFDREQLEEAMLRELNRGGQVYVVHNRVQTIQEMAETIHEIVPRARIAIGHGQMDERDLERVMLDFIAGKYDILISTTIIENGIDIPNVNTIIINRADAFGLSQLYQLRGRVGRDVRQAYAYLILPPGRAITSTAEKRLEALEEFTDLGVGFSIAMRDMEIRGAGDILGRDQHGAINDIGYEMYCRMLEEAVRELRGDAEAEPLWPTEIKWPVDQLLTEEYIPVESQRIRFYKEIAAARAPGDLELITDELLDRYGPLPEETKQLVMATRLKLAAARWKIDTVRLVGVKPEIPEHRAIRGETNEDAETIWTEVRVKAPVLREPLAAELAENASRGRAGFQRLRRAGESIVLLVRDQDPPLKAERLLEVATEWFEALPSPTP